MLVPKRHAAKLMLQLFGVFIGVLVIFLLVVPLLGPCWHLIFGDTISYAGWNVPVPKRFHAQRSPGGTAMWRLSLGIPFFDVPYGHISLFFRPGEPFLFARNYERFAASVAQDAKSGGYIMHERTLAASRTPVYCLQLDRPTGEPNSLVRCAIEGTGIGVFYEGDRKYLSDFYSTLEHMSTTAVGANAKH